MGPTGNPLRHHLQSQVPRLPRTLGTISWVFPKPIYSQLIKRVWDQEQLIGVFEVFLRYFWESRKYVFWPTQQLLQSVGDSALTPFYASTSLIDWLIDFITSSEAAIGPWQAPRNSGRIQKTKYKNSQQKIRTNWPYPVLILIVPLRLLASVFDGALRIALRRSPPPYPLPTSLLCVSPQIASWGCIFCRHEWALSPTDGM